MSPEQCKGKKVGPAADQYSLAVMTYQMLGGHVPFTGESSVEIVHKHVADPVPPLGLLRPNLPDGVVLVVERGLAKTAEERFATVAEFAKALKAASEGVDFTAVPPVKRGGVRMSKTALVSPVPGALRTAKGSWKDRKGLWIGGGLVGVAAVAGVVVTMVLPRLGQQAAQYPAATPDTVTQVAVQPPRTDSARLAPDTATAPSTSRPVPGAPAAGTRSARVSPRGVPTGAVAVTRDGQTSGAPSPGQPPVAAQGAAQPPAVSATARITIGSLPATATMFINGQPMPRNPMRDYEVPAGAVTVRFVATDSATGASWERSFTYTVQGGESRSFGRVTLTRP